MEKKDRIVAVAGVHPYIRLLNMGADVIIIGGRSSDAVIFAESSIQQGFPEKFSP